MILFLAVLAYGALVLYAATRPRPRIIVRLEQKHRDRS